MIYNTYNTYMYNVHSVRTCIYIYVYDLHIFGQIFIKSKLYLEYYSTAVDRNLSLTLPQIELT